MIKIWMKEPKDGLGGKATLELPTGIDPDMMTGAVKAGIRVIDNIGCLEDQDREAIENSINEQGNREDIIEGMWNQTIRFMVTGRDELDLLEEIG